MEDVLQQLVDATTPEEVKEVLKGSGASVPGLVLEIDVGPPPAEAPGGKTAWAAGDDEDAAEPSGRSGWSAGGDESDAEGSDEDPMEKPTDKTGKLSDMRRDAIRKAMGA